MSQPALAKDLIELELTGGVDQRTLTLDTAVTVSSRMSVSAGQRFYFQFGHSKTGFLLEGTFSFTSFSSPTDRTLTNPNAVGYGGRGGFRFGGSVFSISTLGGMEGENLLYAPTSTTVTFARLLVPEISMRMMWVPLTGRGHAIGLQAFGRYQLPGAESVSGLSTTQSVGVGGALFFDFTQTGIPLSIFGNVSNTAYTTSGSAQSRMYFGVGLKLGAAISNPKRGDN